MELYWKAKIDQCSQIIWHWVNSHMRQLQSKRQVLVCSHKNRHYSHLRSRNWNMAAFATLGCWSLKVQARNSHANFLTWQQAFGRYGWRLRSYFVHFGRKASRLQPASPLVFRRKSSSPLRPNQIDFVWRINRPTRLSAFAFVFNRWRHEAGRIRCGCIEKGRQKRNKVQSSEVKINHTNWARMFPDSLHLVPSEYVQVKHFTHSQRTLQNQALVHAQR